MPSELITKNVDLETCVCACKAKDETGCTIDSPLSNGKVENILRLARTKDAVEDIARLTYTGELPNEHADEFSPIDGSPTGEHHKRCRFNAYVEQVEHVLDQAGLLSPAEE